VSSTIRQRFCLKVVDQAASDMVPGTSARNNGIRATTFHAAICKRHNPVQRIQLAYGDCAAHESRPRKKPDGVRLDHSVARRVRVHDDHAAQLSAYPRPIRQLAVTGLGHDQPTLLLTNRPALPARHVIQSYAKRMNIEQRLAEAISSFGLDALAGAVPLNVDLDVVLSVLAHTVCAALRRGIPGYHAATPDTLQRRFLNTGGIIEHHHGQITIRLSRRTYSPVLRQASLPETITVPWWQGRTLHYQYD